MTAEQSEQEPKNKSNTSISAHFYMIDFNGSLPELNNNTCGSIHNQIIDPITQRNLTKTFFFYALVFFFIYSYKIITIQFLRSTILP